MTSNQYEVLVRDPTLYPAEFIVKHGWSSPHWEIENWQRRERSLCHDMICILLSNLEPAENLDDKVLENLKRKIHLKTKIPAKKRRLDIDTPSTSHTLNTNFEASSDSDDSDPDFFPESEEDEGDDYDPIKEFEETNQHILMYRYIVLEGLTNAHEIQAHFISKWKLEPMTKLFDIIDTTEKKFIEVKTTTDPAKIIIEYSNNPSTSPHTSLVVVDMVSLDVDNVNKDEEYPGLSKVHAFLIKRKSLMTSLGIEDRNVDDGNLVDLVFKPEYISKTVQLMETMCSEHIENKVQLSDVDYTGFNIDQITDEVMFEKLRKPLLEKHDEYCVYKGKITPPFYCNPKLLFNEKDVLAIDEFLVELWDQSNFVSGEYDHYLALKELIDFWMANQTESKNFGFIDTKRKTTSQELSPHLKEAFMIGKKGKTFNATIDSPTQEEREEIQNKQYPPWFEELYMELAKDSVFGSSNMGNFEMPSKVPLYEFMGNWLEEFYDFCGRKNLGNMIDLISNFYSRISGSYNTTIGNRTTHSSIAAIPIRFNTKSENELKRWITGIAFRGPHHTRSATDKTNLFIVERINHPSSVPQHFYKKFTILKAGELYYILRKTAIKKIDGIHLTYIRNSLFISSNMIGDIIMRHKSFISEEAFKNLCSSHLTNNESRAFFVDRVIDATLMAILGNSRDEGYFSVFRKFFMVLINRRRQQHSFTFDVEGMCNKLNECIIDNPLSMFFQNSLLFMICNY